MPRRRSTGRASPRSAERTLPSGATTSRSATAPRKTPPSRRRRRRHPAEQERPEVLRRVPGRQHQQRVPEPVLVARPGSVRHHEHGLRVQPEQHPVGNGVTPVRTAGDLLVIYDLSQGGTNPDRCRKQHLDRQRPWGRAGQPRRHRATRPARSTRQPIPAGESRRARRALARTFGEAQLRLASIFPDPTVCQSLRLGLPEEPLVRLVHRRAQGLRRRRSPSTSATAAAIKIHKSDDAGNAARRRRRSPSTRTTPRSAARRGAEDTITTGKTCTTRPTATARSPTSSPGEYWVVETDVPAGYDGAADQHVTVTADTTVDADVRQPAPARRRSRSSKTAKHC